MPSKPLPPSKSNKKAKAVKEKKRKTHTKIQPLPEFPPYIRDVKNPLIGNMHAKRPLVIALAKIIQDDDELFEAVRLCGCLYVIGHSDTKIDDTPIKRNEWSGKGYALRTGRDMQVSYPHLTKLAQCMPFAEALYQSMVDNTVDKDRAEGLKHWETVKTKTKEIKDDE